MNNDLLDRYLAEIARNLPASKRDDIIAEIGDELQSRIESGEGDPFDVIRAYGDPKIVAARYGAQQYLVGPTLLPFYWYALKIVLAIVLGLEIFGAALAAFITKNPALFAKGVGAAWSSAIWVFGIVTIIFILLERFAKQPFAWDPSKLSPAPAFYVPRVKSAFEFIANFSMLLLVAFGGPWVAKLISPLAFTAAWGPAYGASIASTAGISAVAFASYLMPNVGFGRTYARMAFSVVVMVGAVSTLRNGALFTTTSQSVGAVDLAVINLIAQWSVGITIAIVALTLAIELWKLLAFVAQESGRPKNGGNGILNA